MFDGMQRRVVSIWFPRLASDRALRLRPLEGPFALTHHHANTNRIHCLNSAAERAGLSRGMPFSDARAFCPDLQSRPADPRGDLRFQRTLRRWALRYCPWVGLNYRANRPWRQSRRGLGTVPSRRRGRRGRQSSGGAQRPARLCPAP